MTRIIETLAEIGDDYDTLFCDLWGCLHDGVRAYPEAVAALRAFRAGGGAVMLLTNSPRPRPSVRAQLDGLGVPTDAWDDITTSGDAAQAALIEGRVGRRVHHIGPAEHLGFFTDMARDLAAEAALLPQIRIVPLAEAEGIVCTGPVDEMNDTPEDYRTDLEAAHARGLPLLCANPDIVVDHGDRRLWCAGGIARLYEALGGESLYFGKPHAPIYDLARRRLEAAGRSPGRILAIGDGIATDALGAANEGIDALFVTGGLAAAETGTLRQPEPALLADWLAQGMLDPRWSIGFLR